VTLLHNAKRFRSANLVLLLLASIAAPVAQACTSFCFDTAEGPIFGANMDLRWGEGLVFVNRRGLVKQSFMLNSQGERLQWVSRYGSVSFNLVGLEYPWGGMNEAGLVVSDLALEATRCPADDERHPVCSPMWTQFMLDTCATIEEMIAAQDSIRLKGDAVHFMACDASGACAVFEYLGGEVVIHAGEDLPVRALANATYEDCLEYLELGVLPAFNPGASAQRVAAAAEWSERFDPAGEVEGTDWALRILTEAVVDPKKWYKVVFREPYTRWSIAFDIAARRIRFRTEASPSVRSFDFAQLDFECEAPILMMDVNAEFAGPAEQKLQPYDSEWNHRVAYDFLDRWGSGLSDEEIDWLTTFLESFTCAE